MRKFRRIAFFCFIAFGLWILLAWMAADYLVLETPMENADAILVLSGSADYVDRTREAAKLFSEGAAPKIILTNDGLQGGWNEAAKRNPYFAERALWELIRQGVPKGAIETLPTKVESTGDEANLIAAVSSERKLKSLLLVTSAYHSRRALRTFERAAAGNSPALAVGVRIPRSPLNVSDTHFWWASRKGWETIGAEIVKTGYYWLYY